MPASATTRPIRRQKPAPLRRQRPVRRSRISLRTRLILAGAGLIAAIAVWAVFARALAPSGNTAASRFDAIVVLGSPADSEGNPTPTQLSRVTEAVREYERGIAPRLILSGGAAHNRFVEAETMARTAHAQGVPASAIFMETRALDTIQNACYSARIMGEHGWRSAEVISSADHLARAGMIFNRLPLQWRTHAAADFEANGNDAGTASTALEVLKTIRFLIYARWAEGCSPYSPSSVQ